MTDHPNYRSYEFTEISSDDLLCYAIDPVHEEKAKDEEEKRKKRRKG